MVRRVKRFKDKQQAMYGDEPGFDVESINDENYQHNVSVMLNWYSVLNPKDKRKWFNSWAKENGYKIADLAVIPNDYLATVSSVARLSSRGFPLSEKHEDWLKEKVDSLRDQFSDTETVRVSSEDFAGLLALHKNEEKEKRMGEVLVYFDGLIDNVRFFRKLPELKADFTSLTPTDLRKIASYYKKQLREIKLVVSGADDDLVEGYSHYTKPQLGRYKALLESIITNLGGNIVARQRKPRVRKTKPVAKLVEKVKYMASDEESGLVSIDPSKLVGATLVYLFNTKYRRLHVLYCDDAAGFVVKGTTLQNIADRSFYKTIRKPKEFFSEFMSATKPQSSKMVSSVRAVEGKVTGRINEHTVIVKVY